LLHSVLDFHFTCENYWIFYYTCDITSNYYEAVLIEWKFAIGLRNNARSLS